MSSLRRPKLTSKPKKIVNIKDKISQQEQEEESTTNEGCMKYYYPKPIDMESKNLPCETRHWPGGYSDFVDISVYKPKNVYKYVDKYFSNKHFNGDSPFVYQKDFKTKTTPEICNTEQFELKPQQKFLGKFISPETDFPGVLVYHKLGSGKTCTSLVIGEAMKSRIIEQDDILSTPVKGRSPYRIYVVVPKSVKEQYYEEIIGRIKDGSIDSCTGSCVITDKNGEGIRQYYVGYYDQDTKRYKLDKLNEIKKLEENIEELRRSPSEEDVKQLRRYKKELTQKRQEMYSTVNAVYHIISHDSFLNSIMSKDNFTDRYKPTDLLLTDGVFHSKNSLLIIDEIHKLVMEEGTNFNRLYNTLNIYARNYETGTPTMKVVLLTATPVYDNPFEAALIINLLRPRIQFPLSKEKFEQMFIDNSLDENSNMYISKIKNPMLLKYILSGYVSYFQGGNPRGYPKRRNYIKLSYMDGYQENAYVKSLIPEIVKNSRIHDLDGSSQGMYPISTQFCDIAYVYNRDSESIKNTFDDAKKFYSRLKKRKTYEEKIALIRKHSAKFASIIETIKESKGPVFIYSKWVLHGIVGLSIIFDALGWKFLSRSMGGGKDYQNYGIWSPGGLEYKGIRGDNDVEKYTKALRNLFNSPENRDGRLCKVLLGNVVEGISLKRVTQVHICEPWWNMSKMEQIIARGIRLCSHADLPKDQQSVDVYYHCSVMGSYPNYNTLIGNLLKSNNISPYFRDLSRSTIEQKMYISSERKQNINVQFEMQLKQSAVDCYINEEGNIVRLEEVYVPSMVRDGYIEYNGNVPLYNRSTNKYYILEDNGLMGLDVLNLLDVPKMNSDESFVVHNWPFSGLKPNGEVIELEKWQVDKTTKDILLKEDIECFNPKYSFDRLYKKAIKEGEDKGAWREAYNSYVKMQLLGKLIVEYDLMVGDNPVGLSRCLYNVLKNSEKTGVWDTLSPKEKRIHKTQLETLLTLPRALKNKEKLMDELYPKVPLEIRKRLKDYTYAELEGIRERIDLINKLRKKVSKDIREKLELYTVEELHKLDRKYSKA